MGEQQWRYVVGTPERELCDLMDRVGYTDDDIEATQYLAAMNCDRETAAAILLSTKRRLMRLSATELRGVTMRKSVALVWASRASGNRR